MGRGHRVRFIYNPSRNRKEVGVLCRYLEEQGTPVEVYSDGKWRNSNTFLIGSGVVSFAECEGVEGGGSRLAISIQHTYGEGLDPLIREVGVVLNVKDLRKKVGRRIRLK